MPRKTDSNQPADWLFFAQSEIEGVRKLAETEVSYYMCCGKLAEALEKILKAELLRIGWFLEKTHDLQKLADELTARDSDLVKEAQSLVEDLSENYFACRYPGFDLEEPDRPQLLNQIPWVEKLLVKVRKRVESDLGKR